MAESVELAMYVRGMNVVSYTGLEPGYEARLNVHVLGALTSFPQSSISQITHGHRW